MMLYLGHGREDPNAQMDGWGFDGPALTGVDSFEQMYGDTYTVGFSTVEAKNEAQRLTGWPTWDAKVLEVPNADGLIVTNEPGMPTRYYADVLLRETDQIQELLNNAKETVRAATILHAVALRLRRPR